MNRTLRVTLNEYASNFESLDWDKHHVSDAFFEIVSQLFYYVFFFRVSVVLGKEKLVHGKAPRLTERCEISEFRPSVHGLKFKFSWKIFRTCQVSHFKTTYTIQYHIVVTKGLEYTREILQCCNLGAAHIINLSNVKIKRTWTDTR